MINAGKSVEEINASWKKEAKKFEQDRAPFLLYR
jgi:uncharacterized protein YbbC (DUF1343 family)